MTNRVLVAAQAVGRGTDVQGAVRVTETTSIANAKTNRVLWLLALFAIGLVAATAVIGWMLMRAITSRFEQIHRAAVRIGDGDFAVTVPPTGLAEFDRVGSALNHTAQRLGSMVERERAFAAAASHQLRTPIASFRVALEAELLAPQANPGTIVGQGLDTLDRLDRTVTSLLDLARDAPSDRGVLAMPEVVRTLVDRWRQPALLRRRRVEFRSVEPQQADVHASSAAIHHVLDVLVDNALLHGRGDVTIEGNAVEGGYVIRVADQGSIATDAVDLFRKRGPGLSTTSRGIGLSLARTLASAEGAHLRLVSHRPTTFELLFADPRPIEPS
jgi:signal transduction histidine kinase